jgi:uncharacterized SAM-binding protein YcdF (DUF218 family)
VNAVEHEVAGGQRIALPAFAMLWRGLGLLGMAIVSLAGLVSIVRAGTWLLAPLVGVFALAAVLSGWAAAIHLTGGEKFDDRPC